MVILGVDPGSLPEPRPSAHVQGETSEFGGSVPVAVATPDEDGGPWGALAAALAAGLIAAGVVLIVQRRSHGGSPPTEG